MDSDARTKQERFRKYSPELGLLLWAVWDPIGAEVPLDEYESYVPVVWRLLAERADVDEIAEHWTRSPMSGWASLAGGDEPLPNG